MDTGIRTRLAAAALALIAISAPAAGGDATKPVGVVELFTSQGCSSCPPADAVFSELAGRDDIVALAYHVDYWDYLGWRDTLATKANTQRQYDYMRRFDRQSVYTPQVVVNGRVEASGSDRSEIEGALDRLHSAGQGLTVPITVRRAAESIVIEAGEGQAGAAQGHVVIIRFAPSNPTVISRGENRGRTVVYRNAVTDIQTAGMWHGAVARFELPAAELLGQGSGGFAVLLQSMGADGRPGPILGAAVIDGKDML